MHGIKGKVGEEGFVLMLLDECASFRSESIRKVFALRAIGKLWITVGDEVFSGSVRPAPFPAAFVDIKTLVFGIKALGAEMPFPGEKGGIAVLLQCFGKGLLLQGKMLAIACREQRLIFCPVVLDIVGLGGAKPVGGIEAGGVFPGHDGSTGGAADGAGSVGIGESHALFGKVVEVGCLVERAAVAPEVSPAQVVGEDKEEIERIGILCGEEVIASQEGGGSGSGSV